MSGPRPAHVTRRGAIYGIRYRIPADLIQKIRLREFNRSLGTSDPRQARRRAAIVTKWFSDTVQWLREMAAPTRADLETAAQAFFRKLMFESDVPRHFDDDHFDDDVVFNVEMSCGRIDALDDQFRSNVFDERVEYAADRIARKAGGVLNQLDDASRLYALQLAAKAEREQMRFLVHALTNPGAQFTANGFEAVATETFKIAKRPASAASMPKMGEAVSAFLARKKLDKVGTSHLQEMARALDWLTQHLGPEMPVAEVARERAIAFRNGVERLDVRLRGKRTPFPMRQTAEEEFQINPRTAARYWSTVEAFFSWAETELGSGANPARGLKTRQPQHNEKRTPPPFTEEELERLLRTPPYAGHKSPHALLSPGTNFSKGSYWWSGLIALHTGMRAGEIAQLHVGDFDFSAAIPVIHVQVEDSQAATPASRPKKLKSLAAKRDVPISTVLLHLGLVSFVHERSKGIGVPRVFPDLNFGKGDRRSDALTKFWSRLLHQHGLHQPGRATHVFRHTFIAALRRAKVSQELISAIVGHAPTSQTGAYGGAFPIEHKAEAISKLDYGFDISALLKANELASDSG